MPEYKQDLSDLEFRITRPNIAQIYATSSARNLEDTIQSARLTCEYYAAEDHHTISLIVCTGLILIFLTSSEYVTAKSLRIGV